MQKINLYFVTEKEMIKSAAPKSNIFQCKSTEKKFFFSPSAF